MQCSLGEYFNNVSDFLGQCKGRFTNKKIPYCVKFNPDEDKQNLFVAGLADKKIVTVRFTCYFEYGDCISGLYYSVF